jgi:hypothetical protein
MLQKLSENDEVVQSWAYWIGLLKDEKWLITCDADSLCYLMTLQYDTEEQSGYTNQLFALEGEDDWYKYFTPVAPVQLTSNLSPLALALDKLGNSKWVSEEFDSENKKETSLFWSHTQVGGKHFDYSNNRLSLDEKRLIYLLELACYRATEKISGVLLTAKIGWSYDGIIPFDKKSMSLMKRKGFAVTDRKQ